jgi:ABC-type dipeptide/oligopeptide/nickel transport system permease component
MWRSHSALIAVDGEAVGGHVMPNAAIPVVTMIGFLLGALVAGAVITETVFAWPGVGRLIITSAGSAHARAGQGGCMSAAAQAFAAHRRWPASAAC